MKKIDSFCLFVATGFGTGYSPWASGTVGTLPGVAIAFLLVPLSLPSQLLIVLAMIVGSVPICDRAERLLGTKDDGRIVADEMVTFPLCMLGLTAAPLWMWAVAFLTHRVLDILKPAPARKIQELKGGLGIVADDVVSSLYCLGLNHLIFWNFSHLIAR
jgi:phosphatidylglycerophosphatase A